MLIKIGRFEFTECWDGVLYKKLSDYPRITRWELQTIMDFMNYEASYGRRCTVEAEKDILQAIQDYKPIYDSGFRVPVPDKIEECTACPGYKGCMTDFVCHTTSAKNAGKILKCGSLLSPVRARKMSAERLRAETRNAAKDPEDYFYYIMFAWGNCQAGDRLVMERSLGRFPEEDDLSICFRPGIRFYFRYKELAQHPGATFEGVLPMKIRDEVNLEAWVHSVIIPEDHREELAPLVPESLKMRVHYIENDCPDIWAWSEKVYEYVKAL